MLSADGSVGVATNISVDCVIVSEPTSVGSKGVLTAVACGVVTVSGSVAGEVGKPKSVVGVTVEDCTARVGVVVAEVVTGVVTEVGTTIGAMVGTFAGVIVGKAVG